MSEDLRQRVREELLTLAAGVAETDKDSPFGLYFVGEDAVRLEKLLRDAASLLDGEGITQELEALKARASTLEDAAFHFQSCRTCAEDGEDSCIDGRKFAAFLRGEKVEE